tara:strand:- start:10894 stop:11763 length:870 start_codon:yes stop_codon:yes gene_type:complete
LLNSFYSNKSVLALLLAIFFSVIIYFNSEVNSIKNIQKAWLYVKSVITNPVLELQTFLLYNDDVMKLKLDRWVLDTRLKELEERDFSFIKLKNLFLNDSTKSITIVHPKNQTISSSKNTFYTANVLSNRSPQLSSSIFIDIGYNDLSQDYNDKNIIAIDYMGNLVGRVVNETISSKGSMVQLINDVNSRVIVHKKGVLNSTALLVPSNANRFELIGSNNYNINKDDTLYTSYKSDIFIKNIPVCTVISIDEPKDNSSFRKVNVRLLSDFKNLEYVFVIESEFENSRVEY